MTQIVGISFKRAGKIYYFDAAGVEVAFGDQVVVETAYGREIGRVLIAPKEVVSNEQESPLKPVLRRAGPDDLAQWQDLSHKKKEALDTCREMAKKLNLPMKPICAECDLDGTKVTFMFSAEGRVDFRELVRELSRTLKTKVELRQVGPRDETKLCGGFGCCGLPLCCMSHLTEFSPVSIKMAKEQDLPLNPAKISGVCGRLLCCLAYEAEQYKQMRGQMPAPGQKVQLPVGAATVVGGNPLKETVFVESESKATVEVPLRELVVTGTPQGAPKRRRRSRRK
ncbi:MAG: stage 0 sporulation family protein [Chloroflexi bacterium]|nr:stage 0 sporulation family protein [Chloroflexota bacterium]